VLLILAGVAINLALADNGIIKKTTQATEMHKREKLKEQLNLELMAIKMDMISGSNYSLQDIANILGGTVDGNKILVEREGYIFTIEDLTIVDVVLASMSIAINPNEADGVQTINTVLTVENNKGIVDPSSLQYGWSNAKEVQPTEWVSFTSGETITKNIAGSTQFHFVWIKARDTEGNEQIKRSGQFNDADNAVPTVALSKTGDQVGSTSVEITATVTYGFKGVKTVKWLGGTRAAADFASAGNVLTEPYKFTVEESGSFTVYIEGNNGKSAVSTIQVVNIVTTGWQAGTPNAPVLTEGMIPIYWNGTAWEVTETTSPNWYNYIDSKAENATISSTEEGKECRRWANIMLSDRTYKANTVAVGQTIADADLGSMFVWIPRYSYKITKGENTATAGAIAIKWSNNTQDDTSYISHPAFKLGNDELKGIWVAKFEPSRADATSSSNGSNTTVKIVPSVLSWGNLNVSASFTTCRNMEKTSVYGWTAQAGALNTDGSITGDSNNFDVHMMKNVEWGAVAYLTHSIGKTGEVWINPRSGLTGQAGGSASSESTSSTTDYKSANGVHASTTDTVYGIYDMSGGTSEYVMAVSATATASSGFTTLPDSKYYDSYSNITSSETGSYTSNSNKKGDAIYETSSSGGGNTSWYGDSSSMILAAQPWFRRGGVYVSAAAGGMFSFERYDGKATSIATFRPVIGI
jgi:hypothetical protein